jgi:two-component system response regulator AlgR
MKILIVDDEMPARAHLRSLLEEIGPPYQVAGEAASGEEALAACHGMPVDLVLLDIRMPGMDGLTAAARLAEGEQPPAVIFTTAFDEHALAAFERNAIDYLLKPVRRRRLEQALDKAVSLTRPQLQVLQGLQNEEEAAISATFRGGLQRIPLSEIYYFRAEQKYVVARHAAGEALLEESLKSLEKQFGERFLRIHRNALVAKSQLAGLRKEDDGRTLIVLKDLEEQLDVSRRHLAEVRRFLRGRS